MKNALGLIGAFPAADDDKTRKPHTTEFGFPLLVSVLRLEGWKPCKFFYGMFREKAVWLMFWCSIWIQHIKAIW